jgi:flagellar motor protein MotB
MELPKRRAAAVNACLVTPHEADAGRLEATGFGRSKPAHPNPTSEERQANRRVELVKLP